MSERQKIIDAISSISENLNGKLKPLIIKLAENIAQSIDKPDIINMAKIEGIQKPELTDVALIMNHMRKKYNWAFGKTSLYTYCPQEYKRSEVTEYSNPVRLTDNYLEEHYDEIKDKLKNIRDRHMPAKDIISKAHVEDMEKYTWSCWFAQELAYLAIKMEQEHNEKHDDNLCKEYAKRGKLTRDSRFATDMNSYEAIILAMNSSQSLKNAIAGEWEFKTLWEILEDMEKCRECTDIRQCKHENCKHECHRVVRQMTTKGLKYAIKTNEKLRDWDSQVKRLTEVQNDLCRVGKIILDNPKSGKLLGETTQRRLINAHLERDECYQCSIFLDKNPNFFKAVIR